MSIKQNYQFHRTDWLATTVTQEALAQEKVSTVKILWPGRFPPEPVKTSWISEQSDPSHLDRPYVTTNYLLFPDDNTNFILLVSTYQDTQASMLSKRFHFISSLVLNTTESKFINRVLRIKNETHLLTVKFHFSFVGY
jgi:hypothetical protein